MSVAIKHDGGKPRFSLLPWDALREVVAVREYSVKTYGSEHCWQDVEPRRYVDALLRHGAEIVENGIHSRDAESGLLHTAHIACNALFLVWFAGRTQKAAEVVGCLGTLEDYKKALDAGYAVEDQLRGELREARAEVDALKAQFEESWRYDLYRKACAERDEWRAKFESLAGDAP